MRISRIIKICILYAIFLLVFTACGEVKDNADTPFDEEKIMQMQQESPKEISDVGDFDAMAKTSDEQVVQSETAGVVQAEKINPEEPKTKEIENVEEKSKRSEKQEETVRVNGEQNDTVEKATQEAQNENTGAETEEKNDDSEKEEQPTENEMHFESKDEAEVQRNVCTLSVKCDTILVNIDKVSREKKPLVPADGVIYSQREVEFQPGESVFDVLHREMKNNRIHMEFTETPAYKSAYVEGINNLYEFDCGDLSGWVYKVNGKIGNVGCSQYVLKPGDSIEWVYTCDMGRDVG